MVFVRRKKLVNELNARVTRANWAPAHPTMGEPGLALPLSTTHVLFRSARVDKEPNSRHTIWWSNLCPDYSAVASLSLFHRHPFHSPYVKPSCPAASAFTAVTLSRCSSRPAQWPGSISLDFPSPHYLRCPFPWLDTLSTVRDSTKFVPHLDGGGNGGPGKCISHTIFGGFAESVPNHGASFRSKMLSKLPPTPRRASSCAARP